MPRFRMLSVTGVLLLATLLAAACDRAPTRPAVVTATILDRGAPVPGATVELRFLNDSSATAVTDSAGRVRVELAGAQGPGLLEVARDTLQPRPQRVYAPILIVPGDSAAVMLDMDEDPGHQARYVSDTRMARWGRAVHALTAIDSVRSWLESEDDPEVRSALWVALLTAGSRGDPVTVEEADRALEEMTPDAAVWTWRARAMPGLVDYAAMVAEGATVEAEGGQEVAGRRELAVRRATAFVDRVIEAHEGTEAQADMLLAALSSAGRDNRVEEARAYYDRLLADHPDSRWAELAGEYLPNPDVQVGSPAPDAPLPALDSTAPPITPAELAGPATLVDFWAAWCTPCVAEMPVIHEAYERFSDRGFDVVSISFDAIRNDVARFRETYPMPWRHSFVGVEALSDGEVAGAWGVNGLPSAFLVGPDGRIIALEDGLRGDRLMETLERVLAE